MYILSVTNSQFRVVKLRWLAQVENLLAMRLELWRSAHSVSPQCTAHAQALMCTHAVKRRPLIGGLGRRMGQLGELDLGH